MAKEARRTHRRPHRDFDFSRRHSHFEFPSLNDLAKRSDNEPVVVHLTSFEITDDPIPDPRTQRLRPKDRERVLRAGELMHEDPQNHLALFEGLVHEFPHIPQLWNYLGCAYERAGRDDQFKKVFFDTLRRFPDYLFAVVNCANIYIAEGRLDEVLPLLKGRLDLRTFYPGRRLFHVTEVIGLYGMLANYFLAIGRRDIARPYYRLLRDVAPDHPGTKQIGSLFRPHPVRNLLRRILTPRPPTSSVNNRAAL